MEKLRDKNIKASLVLFSATLMAIISVITTDANIMRCVYVTLSIIFFVGTIISLRKYFIEKKNKEIIETENESPQK